MGETDTKAWQDLFPVGLFLCKFLGSMIQYT